MTDKTRFQVLVERDSQGRPVSKVWNFQYRHAAERKARELRGIGYKGVSVWDTKSNPLSGLF